MIIRKKSAHILAHRCRALKERAIAKASGTSKVLPNRLGFTYPPPADSVALACCAELAPL